MSASPLPDNIREILKKLFEWAGQSCLDQLKNIVLEPDTFVGFSVEEDEVKEHLPQLTEFFLSEQNKDKINFFTEDHMKRSSPPPTPEDQLHRGLEHLLLWAGACLANRLDSPTVDSIINIFWKDFGTPPKGISYLPVYGCYTASNGAYYEPFALAANAVLRNLRIHEHTYFKNEIRGLRATPDRRQIPFGTLMVEISNRDGLAPNIGEDKELGKSLAKLRILIRGLFNAPITLPVVMYGTSNAWSPFIYEGAILPRIDVNSVSPHEISDMEFQAFKKHWPIVQLPDLERYNITVSRLDRSEERETWQDTLIDLCIALESLLPSAKSEMTHTYSTWIAALLGSDHAQRKQIYDSMKWIYKLRGSLVHGDTVKDLFKDVSKGELEERLRTFKNHIQRTFTLILLNPQIRTRAGLTDRLLGSTQPLINSPTTILSAKP